MRIEVPQDRDELGEPEQLTWDLFPVVESVQTVHLDENGLPKVGTAIRPGMILVGKIGKTRRFDPKKQPTALEIQGSDFRALNTKYGAMWKDTSLYATATTAGIVQHAYLEETPCGLKAVVEIEPGTALLDRTSATASAIPN